MCLLRKGVPKGEPKHEYGVLLHNMTEEAYYGTCLMTDGRDVTLSWDHLHQAFKRIKEDSYIILRPKEKLLREIFIGAMADTTALELRIARCQSEYKDALDKVAAAKAAIAAEKKKNNVKQKVPKKVKMSDIRVNSHVCMYFTWEELESLLPRHTNVPDGNGQTELADQWRPGTIMKIVQIKWKKKVYTCVFDTPGKFTSQYNAEEILVARGNYLKLKKSNYVVPDSSSDDFSSSDDESHMPKLGTTASAKPNLAEHAGRTAVPPSRLILGTHPDVETAIPKKSADAKQNLADTPVAEGIKKGPTTPTEPQLDAAAVVDQRTMSKPDGDSNATCKHSGSDHLESAGRGDDTSITTANGATVPAAPRSDRAESTNSAGLDSDATELTANGSTAPTTPTAPQADAATVGDFDDTSKPSGSEHPASAVRGDDTTITTTNGSTVPAGPQLDAEDSTNSPGLGGDATELTENGSTAPTTPTAPEVEVTAVVEQTTMSKPEGDPDATSKPSSLEYPAPQVAAESPNKSASVADPTIAPTNVPTTHGSVLAEVKEVQEDEKPIQGSVLEAQKVDRPLGLYNKGNRELRKRRFPCPCCEEPADGSHQCGWCFQHVHVCCATPFQNSPEGFGQIMACGMCVETADGDCATQTWVEQTQVSDIL